MTYVQHDSFVPGFAKCPNGANGAPIELDRRADAIHARAEDHHSLVIEADIVLSPVVCQVQVVSRGRKFTSYSVCDEDMKSVFVIRPSYIWTTYQFV